MRVFSFITVAANPASAFIKVSSAMENPYSTVIHGIEWGNRRPWLRISVSELKKYICWLANRVAVTSPRMPPVIEGQQSKMFGLDTDVVCYFYASNSYPPDGFVGIFVEDEFAIGDDWDRDGQEYWRKFEVFRCEVISDHERSAAFDSYSNSSRPSSMRKIWSITLNQKFISGLPSLEFQFSFNSRGDSYRERNYMPGSSALLAELNLSPVLKGDIEASEEVSSYLRNCYGKIEDQDIYYEVLDEDGIWKGEITIKYASGARKTILIKNPYVIQI